MQKIPGRREKPSFIGVNVFGAGQEPFDLFSKLDLPGSGMTALLLSNV
jgi:hypothetical protein